MRSCLTISSISNSDHLGLQISLSLKVPIQVPKRRIVWRYQLADWDRACQLIDSTDWLSLVDQADINTNWINWRDKFIQECIPSCVLPPRRNRPGPWLTKRLIQDIRRRNALYRHVKATGDYTKFRRYRNKVVNYLRNAKMAYFRKLNPRRTKEFWKTCKLLNRTTSSIPTLTTPSSTAHTNLQKAELLNSFFISYFNRSHNPLEYRKVNGGLQKCAL